MIALVYNNNTAIYTYYIVYIIFFPARTQCRSVCFKFFFTCSFDFLLCLSRSPDGPRVRNRVCRLGAQIYRARNSLIFRYVVFYRIYNTVYVLYVRRIWAAANSSRMRCTRTPVVVSEPDFAQCLIIRYGFLFFILLPPLRCTNNQWSDALRITRFFAWTYSFSNSCSFELDSFPRTDSIGDLVPNFWEYKSINVNSKRSFSI